jgi:glycosyltransferase involved in cell wall biosynthesis
VKTPVVIFAYNRVELLSQVLARVVDASPPLLLLVADGPKRDSVEDREKCEAVRALLDRVRRLYSDVNLGAGQRIASGLDWVFESLDEVVILEDDLLPDATFFPFCDELLERYRDDARIAMISGCNFQFGRRHGPHSYYFSYSAGTWGWATWRRAWRFYDYTMAQWRERRDTGLLASIWPRDDIERYWRDRLDEVSNARSDVWDYQWAFAMWSQRALQVSPNTNLISHIGCGRDATHVTDVDHPLCKVPLQPMAFPLSHPPEVVRDLAADYLEFANVFSS